MGGNRKHGFRRGNASGRNGAGQWYCNGCEKMHPYARFRNGTLDGRSYCDRTDPDGVCRSIALAGRSQDSGAKAAQQQSPLVP